MLRFHHTNRACGPRPVYVTITADDDDSNIHALAGSPAGMVVVYVIVAAGVKVTQMHTGTGWATGSVIALGILGTVAGNGGTGGASGTAPNAGGNGDPGSPALELEDADVYTYIDVSNGYLFGGGGGGGGGATISGTGGAGGGGYPDGAGGSPGEAADPGTWAGGGAGGGGTGAFSTNGGTGGWPGEAGGDGGYLNATYPGGAGGAAGPSVKSNGHGYTIVAGDNSTHVKGPKT